MSDDAAATPNPNSSGVLERPSLADRTSAQLGKNGPALRLLDYEDALGVLIIRIEVSPNEVINGRRRNVQI